MKYLLTLAALLLPTTALAGNVTVVDARASLQSNGTYSFAVTLEHADSGWDHYADRWQVLSPDGTVLATRGLAHPHVNEQPFTRSLSGVRLPLHVLTVHIRAHGSVHGNSSDHFPLKVPR